MISGSLVLLLDTTIFKVDGDTKVLVASSTLIEKPFAYDCNISESAELLDYRDSNSFSLLLLDSLSNISSIAHSSLLYFELRLEVSDKRSTIESLNISNTYQSIGLYIFDTDISPILLHIY